MKSPITFLQGIIITIVVSVILLILFIIFSNKNTFGLVEKDYYQKALTYQEQIDKETETNRLEQTIDINVFWKKVVIQFPAEFRTSEISGEIKFFRPSDTEMDFSIPVKIELNGTQALDTKRLENGAWIVQIYWDAQGKEYYSEKRIFIEN